MIKITKKPYDFNEFISGTLGITRDNRFVKYKSIIKPTPPEIKIVFPMQCGIYSNLNDLKQNKEFMCGTFKIDGNYSSAKNGHDIINLIELKNPHNEYS